jgi:hypothetical protein
MSEICIVDDCDNNAFYGNVIDYKKKYCKEHKNIEDNLIDIRVKNNYCKSCLYTFGIYGYINDKKNLFCKNCKNDDMIDIRNKKCIKCEKRPTFNYPNESKPLFCKDCKLDNMVDVINPKCIKCDDKYRVYNYPNESKPLFCKDCKLDGMIDVLDKKCIFPLCDKFQKIEQYCYRCFYALFPNDERCKYIKLKENEVKKYIQETFKNLSFIFDEPIKGDGLCINKRPDILLNLNKHSIIIEIDENQHKGYVVGCDDSRTLIIQEALNRPTIFIRFNPDDYVDENNKKVLSPFKIDKKLGLTTIPKNNENEWNNRLLLLKETINNNLEYKSDEPITIIKLFYDKII